MILLVRLNTVFVYNTSGDEMQQLEQLGAINDNIATGRPSI